MDFALYGAVGNDNLAEAPGMAEAGAIAFKTFLTAPPPGRAAEFVGLCCPNMGDLPDVMDAVARIGLRHCFHCEHEDSVRDYKQKMLAAGRGDIFTKAKDNMRAYHGHAM